MSPKFKNFLLLPLLFALLALPAAFAEQTEAVDLMWDDLQPAANELEKQKDKDNSEPALSNQSPLPAQKSADVVAELNGKRVRIPAYVVPLDGDQNSLTEMLLVPYFGACVHVPPPPPNQIIHISEEDGVSVEGLDLYNPVWVTGVLRTQTLKHDIAEIGYRMEVENLTKYNPRARKK